MYRTITNLLILIFLSNCSIDTKSGIWKNQKEPLKSKKLQDFKFTNDMTYGEFKKKAIDYGKLSDFPKLDK